MSYNENYLTEEERIKRSRRKATKIALIAAPIYLILFIIILTTSLNNSSSEPGNSEPKYGYCTLCGEKLYNASEYGYIGGKKYCWTCYYFIEDYDKPRNQVIPNQREELA